MKTDHRNLILQVPANSTELAERLLPGVHNAETSNVRPSALLDVARKHHLALIVIFGSRAKGRASERSDIDVGALPIRGKKFDPLKFFCDISPILNKGNVDVIDLREAPDLLNWNVAQEGIPIFVQDAGVWDSFRIRAIQHYEDTRRLNCYKLMAIDRFLAEQ